jgi:hypothetical protein
MNAMNAMNQVTLQPHVKPPELASRDRDLGSTLAFVVFGAALVTLFFVLRRVRSRALLDRADRELRDEIEDATKEAR